MSVGMEMERMDEGNDEKILCAIRTPEDRSKNPWFYNIFFKHIYKEDKKDKMNEIKVNYLVALTKDQIASLKENTCKVFPLIENISFEIEDDYAPFKEGFKVMIDLFNKAMNDNTVKGKIRELLTNSDGKPNTDYKVIMKTKKLLEE